MNRFLCVPPSTLIEYLLHPTDPLSKYLCAHVRSPCRYGSANRSPKHVASTAPRGEPGGERCAVSRISRRMSWLTEVADEVPHARCHLRRDLFRLAEDARPGACMATRVPIPRHPLPRGRAVVRIMTQSLAVDLDPALRNMCQAREQMLS